MGIIDRVILSIYTLLLAFLSIGVIVLSLRLVSLDLLETSLKHIYGQWEAGLIGTLFLLVSVRLMLAGVRSRHAKDTIVHHNDLGDVHITVVAVENLIEKTARHIKGVRGVKIRVVREGTQLKVAIKAVVSPDCNVPSVSGEIQARVYEHIKNIVGLELADVRVLVEDISNDFKVKQRVE